MLNRPTTTNVTFCFLDNRKTRDIDIEDAVERKDDLLKLSFRFEESEAIRRRLDDEFVVLIAGCKTLHKIRL